MSHRESVFHKYLPLLSLISTIVAADQSPLVSEGTCYYKAGAQADSIYIPCGNSAFGVYSCCMKGDNCLSSNACFNAKYSNAYIAGCTDPTYSDPACGNKGQWKDLQYAIVQRCYVSTDTSVNQEEWGSCDDPDQPIMESSASGCVCTASAHTAVFTDNPNLTNIGVLPSTIGGTIGFGPGHTPASDLTPTAQAVSSTSLLPPLTSSSSVRSSSISPASSTSPPTVASQTTLISSTTSGKSPASEATTASSAKTTSTPGSASPSSASTNATGSKGISTGAEAGIGVGVGLGVLLACAILFLLYRRRLKRRYSQNLSTGREPSRNESMRSPAWWGHKSELPAAEKQRSELLGSTQRDSMAKSPVIPELEGTSKMTKLDSGVSPINSATTSTAYELPGSSH